jgi:hypothetical protein
METLELIYEVFTEIRMAEENKDEILLERKRKELDSLRLQLVQKYQRRGVSSINREYPQVKKN